MELQKIVKDFTGGMDIDSPFEVVSHTSYVESWNGRMNGPKGNERFEIIAGNLLLPGQSMTDGGGGEKTIGYHRDEVYRRVFFFNYSQSGNHGIYIYNSLTGIFQTLIRIGVTVGAQYNALNFTADGEIGDINIIYGDPLEGNILCFLDSAGKPRKINIERYLANTYGFNYSGNFLNVIKAPPVYPPRVLYENDNTVRNNNQLNSLFKFATAFVYDDNDKSVLSAGSKVPLPVNSFSNTQNIDKTLDARIGIYFFTGGANVRKIKLFVKITQNGATSNWLEVDTIDKVSGNISDNTQYKYLFYNSGNYPPADINYSNQLYDYVPDVAGCQTVANGDTLVYGNITEGYDWFKSNFSNQLLTNPASSSLNGVLFFAATNGSNTGGQPNINVYLTCAGINDAAGNPISFNASAPCPDRVFVNAISNTSDISFTVSGLASLGFISSILTLVGNAAVAAGWVIVPTPGIVNYITMYYPTGTIVLKSSYYDDNNTDSLTNTRIKMAHYEQSNYSYGIRYLDPNGKSNGVITDVTANLATLPGNLNPGYYNLSITGILLNLAGIIPPAWATHYEIMRTDTLTYNKYLNWVSNQAFSNVGQLVDVQFAYLGITNIDDINTDVLASQINVSYSFTQGDRVRITTLYQLGATVQGLLYDYPILGLSINPTINGETRIGRFLKIAYPTNDINTTNLQFIDDANFSNYGMTIYNIGVNGKQAANAGATQNQVYFAQGLKFSIGNPGLPTAYHFGNVGDNKVNIQEGDVFYRQRVVPVGASYFLNMDKSDFSNRYITPKITPTPNATIIVPGAYTISTQAGLAADPFSAAAYPKYSDSNGLIINNSPTKYNLRLRGSFKVTTDSGTWVDLAVKVVGPTGNTVLTPFLLQHSEGVNPASEITITFDGKVELPAGYKAWFIYGNGQTVTNIHITGYQLQLDVVRNITIQCFDPSYSDTFNLVTNADNRADIADPTQRRITYGTLYRWSLKDQLNTSLNDSNRFYFENSDETVKTFGNIQKLTILGKLMHVFHERKCGTVGIFSKWIKNNSGTDQLIVSDTIFEKNNIHYEIYEGGCGNQPSAVVISNYAHYLVDPVNGYILRWSLNGVDIISLLYKTQTWAGSNLPKYLSPHTSNSPLGGNAKVLGTFLSVPDNHALYIMLAQGGTSATGDVVGGRSVVFDETDNAFEGFWNIDCDAIITSENTLYSFNLGKMYIHNNTANYANFFGVQYPVIIDLVWNEKTVLKKSFMSIGYQSNQYWIAKNVGSIKTSEINQQTGLQQISQLLDVDQEINGGVRYGAFKQDANSLADSREALVEGDPLEGNWLETRLEYDGGQFCWLFSPYILFELNPRNF